MLESKQLWLKFKDKKIINFPYLILNNTLGLLFLLILYVIKPFTFIKIYRIVDNRIGHLSCNTDLLLRRLQLKKGKNMIFYLGIATSNPCNDQLLKMFKRKLPIIQNNFLYLLIQSLVMRKSIFYEEQNFHTNEYYEFNNTRQNLFFTQGEEIEGKKLLAKIGINSWFVCFHSRDSAYLFDIDGKHNYRNTDIKKYLEAAKYITSCGGFALRMGSIVEKKLSNLNNPQIIDYASCYRSDFGDIYLSAKCKFSFGDTAGLWTIPTIFHVPVAVANFTAPFDATPFRRGDLFIPKRVWSIEKNRFLTFQEILDSEICHFLHNRQFKEAELVLVESPSEEILDLVKEMNERLDGTWSTTEEDEELQKRYWSLIKPHHHCYNSPARVGTLFLRKNKELLD